MGRKKSNGVESIQDENDDENNKTTEGEEILSTCQACKKPWDKYRGKRRCPTCGVPLLICKNCHSNDRKKVKKLDISVRCDLCIKEGKLQSFFNHHLVGLYRIKLSDGHMHLNSLWNFFSRDKGITSKKTLRQKEQKEIALYEQKLRAQYGFNELSSVKRNKHSSTLLNRPDKGRKAPNPENITRLFLKNLNVREVDQPQLCELVEGITHIEWIMDTKTKKWYGSVFVEVDTPENAGKAVGSLHKQKFYGRVIQCRYSKPDSKSIWPPPNSAI